MTVKKIKIGGFRGLLAPFTLELNGKSAVIYGRNGTGKSSITDAWEWFHKGEISHLQREGARFSSYPHREASNGDTFVEVYFNNKKIDNYIKVQFNHSKKTKPYISGDIKSFRKLSPYPCHLRYRDLTQFVYYTKTEKYDSLANLMGFEKQVEFQKSLRKVERKLLEQLEKIKQQYKEKELKVLKHIGCDKIDEEVIIGKVNGILQKWDIESINKINEIKVVKNIFRNKVEKDPTAEKLNNYQSIKKMIQRVNIEENISEDLYKFYNNFIDFLDKEIETSRIMLISLYEKGLLVLDELKKQKQDINICPLCGQKYPGNLMKHIKKELSDLTELNKLYRKLNEERIKIIKNLPKSEEILNTIEENSEIFSKVKDEFELNKYIENVKEIISITEVYKDILELDCKNIAYKDINKINQTKENLGKHLLSFKELKIQMLSNIEKRMELLISDKTRKQLIGDYEWINDLESYLKEYFSIKNKYKNLTKVVKSYSDIVDNVNVK